MTLRQFIAFHLVKGIGFKGKKELLERFNFDFKKITELLKANKISLPFKLADRVLEKCEKKEIEVITFKDSFYPQRLKEIQDPPVCLFVKGKKDVLKMHQIAFVGTRRASVYGIGATEKLISDLSRYCVSIASGFANGIDTAAHKSALNNKMPTVAVLGCGVDVIYPRSNEKLFYKLIEKGCVISEFPPGTKPEPFRFPVRNRIISGISLGVVVVEAREKSGSMITLQHALNQGREVFAVPGRIFDKGSISTNNRIKNGEAKLVLNGEDIAEEFSFVAISEKSDKFFELSDDFVESYLSDSPKTIEELLGETGLDYGQLITKLSLLELEGKIIKNALNQYVKRV